MNIDYSYPEPSDPDFQKKIYEKREFIYYSIPERPDTSKYKDIKEYRDNICGRPFALYDHQAMMSNFINPDTPYKGVLVFHGLGSGKTCVGVAIAEKFKPLVMKYNTKIIVLVTGPLMTESWKKSLITCTNETYLKQQDKNIYVNDEEKQKEEKNAIIQALQYYKFMSFKSFHKKVIGERIVDKVGVDGGKATYRKTDDGDFERDVAVDRIYNLNNTVIIVDEAHNLTGNTWGDALKLIIKNSLNLKVVLMSGTPMKNLGSDVIEIMNFLRPEDSQVERDKIFTNEKGHMMDFKKGGLEYLKNMMKGYISHIRGGDPLIFAKRVDKGVKPKELLFTNVIRCYMSKFQRTTYDNAEKESAEDSLDRKAEAVANFVFPGLSEDKKELKGYYANNGLALVKNQLEINGDIINKKLSMLLFGTSDEENLLVNSSDGKSISGRILKSPYLKYFSTKFYKTLKKLNRLVCHKKGAKTAFVYSNLVTVGISLFNEILLQNGYLEFQEDSSNYQINDDTVCYYCGKTYKSHKDGSVYLSRTINSTESNSGDESSEDSESDDIKSVISEINISDSSTEYEEKNGGKIPKHVFHPATFITITGQSNEDSLEALPEDKKRILDKVFNILENKDGKYLKFVLGSRVMNEGISLRQVGEVHILDAYFNFARIDQVIGRGIRNCSHYKLMSEENVYPEVNVYKYVVALEEGNLSTEEQLYQKAEIKYMLIKKIERAMKEVAIDCPLNMNGNVFKEEVEKYKDCEPGVNCPATCDYTKCDYKCDGELLNSEYYDPNRLIYKKIAKNKLDYTTFTEGLARTEINNAKNKIKEMYISNYMYQLNEIVEYVKNSYDETKNDLFDEFFVYKALDELIPFTENDFNNFKDIIVDKYNRQGYLIYINKYYIFQPFDQNENVPMYYRTNVTQNISQELSLYNYLKNSPMYSELKKSKGKSEEGETEQQFYDFDSAMEYYDSRILGEFDYVGVIDKDIGRNKSKMSTDIPDAFKIREKRPKIVSKLRATGVVSFLGSMCVTRSKDYLKKVMKKMDLSEASKSRSDVCNSIKDKMLLLEKYGTTKDKNKYTYVIVPYNHKTLPFPYNLEDRSEYIIEKIKKEVGSKITIDVKTKNKTSGNEKGYPSYIITIKDDTKLKDHVDFLKELGLTKEKDLWTIVLE